MNKMLLICNDDSEMLKTLITEDSIDIHKKFHNVFIFISNIIAPSKIEEDDRRFIIMDTSSEKRGDQEYFSQSELS